MIKKFILAAVFFAAIGIGFVSAQTNTDSHAYTKEMGHARIVTLKDRIKTQRQRITEGLAANTITADQAASCVAVLDAMAKNMKAEREANGPGLIMTRANYDAYNTTLDANSKMIHEQKAYFYYYGPYADSGADYNYYYDAYAPAATPTTSMPAAEKASPRIFELRARIQAQRDRIQQDLAAHTLNTDQANSCDEVLNDVNTQMKADYAANGTQQLTRDQYTSLNATLDVNSSVIQESKHLFYYYGDSNLYSN